MMQPWTISFRGKSWSDDQVTVMHACAVAELTDDSWQAVSPWNGPRHLAAWLAVLLAVDTGDLTTSTAMVNGLSLSEFAGVLSERKVDEPTSSTTE